VTALEELRAAAAEVREIAGPVAHYTTPWRAVPPVGGAIGGDDQWRVGYATDNPLAGLIATTPDYGQMYIADWIALMSPALAEPLAELLDGVADVIDGHDPDEGCECVRSDSFHSALRIAMLINGSTP
jgi:hypothetical protein